MEPRAGTRSTAGGRICPKATTTATSAPNSARRLGHSGSRSRAGWTTGRPAASRTIGLGDDRDDVVVAEERLERRQRELRRAVEEDLKARRRGGRRPRG